MQMGYFDIPSAEQSLVQPVFAYLDMPPHRDRKRTISRQGYVGLDEFQRPIIKIHFVAKQIRTHPAYRLWRADQFILIAVSGGRLLRICRLGGQCKGK